MKLDVIIYFGSTFVAGVTKYRLGSFENFNIIEKVLIWFYILLVAIIGAVVINFSAWVVAKIKDKWIGKKNSQKYHSLA